MTKLKTLAVTAVATLAIGAGGLATAPTASAQPKRCADVPEMLHSANQALAAGEYNTAWNGYTAAMDVIRRCPDARNG
jgi:hypothetical protein